MRKIQQTGIIAVLILISFAVQAQRSSFRQELGVGASFGTNFSSVTFSPKVKQGMQMGFSGGATVRWNTEANLGLQAELNFSQEGWSEQYDSQPSYEYKRSIQYLELPFLTHIYFGSKRMKFFVNLGPKVGYAFSEKTTSNLPDGFTPEENSATEQHNMPIEKKFEWGLCGGPGMELRTGIGYFLLEGRYYYALGDIYNSRKEDYFSRSASQVISVKLTYLMPFFL